MFRLLLRSLRNISRSLLLGGGGRLKLTDLRLSSPQLFTLLSLLPLSEIHLHLETKFPRTLWAVHFVEYIFRVPSMSTIGSPACHIDLQIEESALILKFYGAFCALLYIITTFLSHLRNLMRPDKFSTCFPLFLLEIFFLLPTLWAHYFLSLQVLFDKSPPNSWPGFWSLVWLLSH